MKRYLICTISIMFLLIATSCYQNPIMEYTPNIIDNGQYTEDLTYHIVSVIVPDGYEDIYYSTDNSSPTSNSSLYSPEIYEGVDSEFYEGILLKEGETIYAIGYKSENGNAYSTFVSNMTIGVSKWDISIVDNGPYSEDTTKHIITITDSLWEGHIFYYSFSKYDEPSLGYRYYNVGEYSGVDSKKYKGVLVPAGDTIKAYSMKEIKGGDYSSNVAVKLLNQWAISIVDNGPALDDSDKRIVSIVDPTYSSTDIYYTIDDSALSDLSTKYTPAEYQGTDSQTYVGVLLPEATTVKAVAERMENGKKVTSFTSEITTDINKWDINIIDCGESSADNTKRIVSIEDTKWNGSIYYTLNGTDPTTKLGLEKYTPAMQKGVDGTVCEGILVDEAITLKAYSDVSENGKTQKSNVVEKTMGINRWNIKIKDNGQYSCDKSKRIVEIIDLKWKGDIYYSFSNNLSEESIKYIESEYIGSDDITYKGILVPEATLFQAFSQYKFNGETIFSYVSEELFDTNLWSIDMIDNGQLYNDENAHILSIIDDDREGIIYYTLDGSTPSDNSLLYEPTEYEGVDGKTYSGVLVSQNDVFNAISYQKSNGILISSKVCKIYKIGDIGPAGGVIFYDKGYRSDGWRYLEAAPADLSSGYKFGESKDSIGTQREVGTGKSNTKIIMEKLGNGTNAAIACSDYSYNDYNDWFLPSLSELWLMCTNLHNKGLGNFKDGRGYLSSSEYSGKNSCVWIQWFSENCYKDWSSVEYSWNIRPARSF